MIGLQFTLDFGPMRQALERTADALPGRLVDALTPIVREMVDDAKANHAWQNRTGDAERGLWGEAEELTDGLVWLFLAHGPDIDYGLILESIQGGKFGVIRPTFDEYLPRIRAAVRSVL